MSRPVLSGERLAVAVENGVARVSNDPGFSSDNGDGCPYRSVWLRGPGFELGRELTARTLADQRWPGFFESRSDLSLWRQSLAPGEYFLRVYGGSFFKGWGDVPDNYIEWGWDDQGKNPSGVPRVNEMTFTVAAAPPPPPPVEAGQGLPAELQTLVDNVEIEQLGARAGFTAWLNANPGEWQQCLTYLMTLADGVEPTPPPNLRTRRGRAVSGILQTYAIAKGLAK